MAKRSPEGGESHGTASVEDGGPVGYTPLTTLSLGRSIDQAINDGSLAVSAGPSQEGVFFVDAAAFGGSSVENEDALDFEGIADRALSALDAEYRATLQRGRSADFGRNRSDDDRIIAAAFDRLDRKTEDEAGDARSEPVRRQNVPSEVLRAAPDDVVRKAVASIAARSDIDARTRAWESENCIGHDLIPDAPLRAFRRSHRAKARRATANLTRSATMADAFVRLGVLQKLSSPEPSADPPIDSIVVHILGIDTVECSSQDRIRHLFGPFVRWIDHYLWKQRQLDPSDDSFAQVRHAQLDLVGRDLPSAPPSMRQPLSVLGDNPRHLRSATAVCHTGLYHEWLAASNALSSDTTHRQRHQPHLVIAFNAGIWGYQEWSATLRHLSARPPVQFVVTSYTLEEAQDDQDTIERLRVGTCLWPAQPNPYASRQIRDLQQSTSTKSYRENAAWQAWSIGSDAKSTE